MTKKWVKKYLEGMVSFIFSLPKDEIIYFRFILESYDGIGTQTSIVNSNTVEWKVPNDQEKQAERLMHALFKELNDQ